MTRKEIGLGLQKKIDSTMGTEEADPRVEARARKRKQGNGAGEISDQEVPRPEKTRVKKKQDYDVDGEWNLSVGGGTWDIGELMEKIC